MYSNPIVDTGSVANLLGLSPKSSIALINDFVEGGLLKELTGFKRNRVYIFDKYVSLFKD